MRACDLKIVTVLFSLLFLSCPLNSADAGIDVDWSVLDDAGASAEDDAQPMKLKIQPDADDIENAEKSDTTLEEQKQAEIDAIIEKYRTKSKALDERDELSDRVKEKYEDVDNKYSFNVKFNEDRRILKPSVTKPNYDSSKYSTPYSSSAYKPYSKPYESTYKPYNYSKSFSSADDTVSTDRAYEAYMERYRKLEENYAPYLSGAKKYTPYKPRDYDRNATFEDEYNGGPTMMKAQVVEDVKREVIEDKTAAKAPNAPIDNAPLAKTEATAIPQSAEATPTAPVQPKLIAKPQQPSLAEIMSDSGMEETAKKPVSAIAKSEAKRKVILQQKSQKKAETAAKPAETKAKEITLVHSSTKEQPSKEITAKAITKQLDEPLPPLSREDEKAAAERARLHELEKDTWRKMVAQGEASQKQRHSGVKTITAPLAGDVTDAPDEGELKDIAVKKDNAEPHAYETQLPELTPKKSASAMETAKIEQEVPTNIYARQAATAIGDKSVKEVTSGIKMASLIGSLAGENKVAEITKKTNTPTPEATITSTDNMVTQEDKKFIESENVKETLASLEFGRDSSELSTAAKDELNRVAELLTQSPNLRVQIQAFSYAKDKTKSDARRMSLSRGLIVRAYLTDKGIKPVRLDIRALGDQTSKNPMDRVDIVFLD